MNHFNTTANTWDNPEKIQQNKKYSDAIKNHIGKSQFKNILEVGCGTGLLGENFVSENNSFTGVDTSEGMLSVFDKKFAGISNVRSLLLNLEKENLLNMNKFDLILSSMAFHHLASPLAMIQKLSTVISEEGSICIIDLDKEDGSFHPDPANMGVHHFGFSPEEIKNWAQASDLEVYFANINTILKNEKSYPVFLAVFKKIKHKM